MEVRTHSVASVPNILTPGNFISLPGRRSGAITGVQYNQAPNPFVIPAANGNIPHDFLRYSPRVLEEIMFELSKEINNRTNTQFQWRKYKAAAGDTIEFTNFTPQKAGTNLRGMPIKFFYQYVKDIQNVIDSLIQDNRVPDSREGYLARIFANNTSKNGPNVWNTNTKLRDGFRALDPDATGQSRVQILNPLTAAQNGEWLFTDSYIEDLVPYPGVTVRGESRLQTSVRGLDTKDSRHPQSPIGLNTASGIAGLDVRMTSRDRPFTLVNTSGSNVTITKMPRTHESNTLQGIGTGQVDTDQGYTSIGHFPEVVQMLRYQPPQLEWFPDDIAQAFYVSPITSPSQFNIDFILAQPIIRNINQNWGNWLLKGTAGISNTQLQLKVANNAAINLAGQCPQNVFFPDPFETCSCIVGADAYAIWFAAGQGFIWEGRTWTQFSRAQPIKFGPNTKLTMSYNTNGSVSDASVSLGQAINQQTGDFSLSFTGFSVRVKTERLGDVNFQPFRTILEPGQTSVNLQSVLAADETALIPGTGARYSRGGQDRILALQILIQFQAQTNKTVQTQDGPTGSFIPPEEAPTCPFTEVFANVNWIRVEEEEFVGDPLTAYF